MTYPTVVGTTHGTDVVSGTSISVALPNGCNIAGRILIVHLIKWHPTPVIWPTYNWQQEDIYSSEPYNIFSETRSLELTGQQGFPASGATITLSGGSGSYGAYAWLLSGAEAPNTTAASGSGGNADPPPLTSGLGDYLWIVMAGWVNAVTVSDYPSGYSANRHTDSIGTHVTHARCSRTLAAGTDNPGPFTSTAAFWRTVTIAVKGIAGGGVVGQAAQAFSVNRVVSGRVAPKAQAAQAFTFGRVTQGGVGTTGAGILSMPSTFSAGAVGIVTVHGATGTGGATGSATTAPRAAAGGLTYLFGDEPLVIVPPPPPPPPPPTPSEVEGDVGMSLLFMVSTTAGRITHFHAPPPQPRLRIYLGSNISATTDGYPFLDPVAWVEITDDVRDVSWQRGRQRELDEVQAGSASLLMNNESRRWDPTNTAGQFYPLTIDRQIKIEAEWQDVVYPLFRGFVAEYAVIWDAGWPGYSETQIELVDAISLMVDREVNTSPATTFPWYQSESVSARIGRMLDKISFPTSMRSLTGGGLVVSLRETEGIWEHIQRCVQSDANLTVCRVDRRGWVVYSGTSASGATFGDQPSNGELQYSGTGLRVNMDLVYTHGRVTRAVQPFHDSSPGGGDPEGYTPVVHTTPTVTVNTPKRKVRILERSGTLNPTETAAGTLASALYSNYSVLRARPEQMKLRPGGDADMWPTVLGMDIESTFTLRRRPPGGGPLFEQTMKVLSLQHSVPGDVTDWTVSYSIAGSAV